MTGVASGVAIKMARLKFSNVSLFDRFTAEGTLRFASRDPASDEDKSNHPSLRRRGQNNGFRACPRFRRRTTAPPSIGPLSLTKGSSKTGK